MKKGCSIAFFMPVFFVLACCSAGENVLAKAPGVDVATALVPPSYASGHKNQPPAVLATGNFFTSVVSAAGIGLQKIFPGNDSVADRLNYSLLPIFSPGGNEFLQQKKYLLYTYPTHHFW